MVMRGGNSSAKASLDAVLFSIVESRALMRPLLHIGYHKTGTTWLQRQVFPNAEAGFSFVARPKALRPGFVVVDPFDFEPQIVRKNFEPRIREAQEKDLVPVLSFERLS